jgi:signal transduction histidine kinase
MTWNRETERKQLAEHPQREQDEAEKREEALNRRMKEFLGIASHELRTPLTSIKANVQLAIRRLSTLMKPDQTLPEDIASKVHLSYDMLLRAERQIGVLNRLIGDLIDISRIQTGKMQIHLREDPCNLLTIIREVVQEQRKTASNRSISLQAPSVEWIPVIADSDRIAQVITNYMNNALKYSAEDKPVELRLAIEDGLARVFVRDQGPGLNSIEQQRIWQGFYQADDIKVQSGFGPGLGLGLHISRTIIEQHHGQVGVESTPGEGSTFWFTLPLAQGDAATTGV